MAIEIKAFFKELIIQIGYACLAALVAIMVILDIYAIANLFWGVTYAIR